MNKLIFASAAVLTLTALHPASAEQPTAATSTPPAQNETAAAAEPTPPPPALEVKNKPAFTMEGNGRNPFWPIGWKPTPKIGNAEPNEPAGPQVHPDVFLVSSIVMDPRARFAIINGKVMNEGQVFGLQMGTSTYQITVKSSQDGQGVLVRGRDQEIVGPLRRR